MTQSLQSFIRVYIYHTLPKKVDTTHNPIRWMLPFNELSNATSHSALLAPRIPEKKEISVFSSPSVYTMYIKLWMFSGWVEFWVKYFKGNWANNRIQRAPTPRGQLMCFLQTPIHDQLGDKSRDNPWVVCDTMRLMVENILHWINIEILVAKARRWKI